MDSKYSYICGSDLCKFYARPLDIKTKPKHIIHIMSDSESEHEVLDSKRNMLAEFTTVGTQTDYRENEAQTDPWDPPFVINRVHKLPEVLSLKELSYGNGLPASEIEIDFILKDRKNKKSDYLSENNNTYEEYLVKKKLICNKVRNEWNYKISKHSEKQLDKLKQMELALTHEIAKQSEKKEKLLKNIYTQKNDQMLRMNSKFKKELMKEIKMLEKKSKHESQKFDSQLNKTVNPVKKQIHCANKCRDTMNEEINYLLSKYYNSPSGLAKITNWMERKKAELYNEIPRAKTIHKSQREKLIEKAYEDLIISKQSKMPPKIYHEDYIKEENSPSSVKPEVEFELLKLPEEGIDLVTIWQQVLRGRAYQKQMLELIEKHKDALDIILT